MERSVTKKNKMDYIIFKSLFIIIIIDFVFRFFSACASPYCIVFLPRCVFGMQKMPLKFTVFFEIVFSSNLPPFAARCSEWSFAFPNASIEGDTFLFSFLQLKSYPHCSIMDGTVRDPSFLSRHPVVPIVHCWSSYFSNAFRARLSIFSIAKY